MVILTILAPDWGNSTKLYKRIFRLGNVSHISHITTTSEPSAFLIYIYYKTHFTSAHNGGGARVPTYSRSTTHQISIARHFLALEACRPQTCSEFQHSHVLVWTCCVLHALWDLQPEVPAYSAGFRGSCLQSDKSLFPPNPGENS
jgi:hypothetical protein